MKLRPEPITFRGFEELPPAPLTLGSTTINLTGSWKYLRPVYHNKTAPCLVGCPNGNDIEAVMVFLAQKDYRAAWERLVWENPFPAITGRVCYHPCETACNRSQFDTPVAIHTVERFLGDHALKQGWSVEPVAEPKDTHVAVVGGGPAGLAAAYHLARLGHKVTLFEAAAEPGGMLRYGIPQYRLPKDILKKDLQKLYDLGVTFRLNTRIGRDVAFDDLRAFDAVFLAIGLERSRNMGIPGEDLNGVFSGLDFLRRLNTGESVAMGNRVVVIGGGNTAMDAARSALRLGKHVTILYRRSREEMPAIEDEIEEALAEGIELQTLVAPVRILGKNGHVTGIELIRMRLGEPDESGRRRPIPIEGSEFQMPVDAVISAIGEAPDFSFLPDALEHTRNVVHIDAIGSTSKPPFFAGGDIVEQPHTVIDAMASGKRAAMAIDMFLCGMDLTSALDKVRLGDGPALSMRRYVLNGHLPDNVDNHKIATFEHLNVNYFKHADRRAERQRDVRERIRDFDEVNLGFTEDMLQAEVARCFNCGVCNACDNCFVFCPDFAIQRNGNGQPYLIDYNYCKGCGICAHECPRDAISMVKERV